MIEAVVFIAYGVYAVCHVYDITQLIIFIRICARRGFNGFYKRGCALFRRTVCFRDLRHSFATLSIEQGMDIKTVSHMLGHTDAGFTMNTYMHVTDSMQENIANTMGNLIESVGKDTKKILFST